jgi:hypothetical protein
MEAATFNLVLLIVIVLTIAIFVGLNVKGFIGEKKKRDKLKFPPFPSKCPDYWTNIGDSRCKNEHNLGLCKKYNGTKDSNVMDFGDDIFRDEKGMFYKCSWANKCRTPWEGIDKLCI